MANIANRCFSIIGGFILAGTALGQAAPKQCGYDRWPVKVLADKDRARVNFTPIDSTIAELVAIPIHEIPYPRDKRIAPEEMKVYRIRAKLVQVRTEKDSDLHLILEDPDKPEVRMIAEIPVPFCAEGTGHEDDYSKARTDLTSLSVGSIVEVIGVGFFDFLHDAIGGAKNGIELHPVLKISRFAQKSDRNQ